MPISCLAARDHLQSRVSLRGTISNLSLNTIWLALPLMLAFGMLNLAQIPPNDFWWHLRTGQIIVSTGAIPTTDLFSFSQAGQPWVNQSWLMQAWFYLLYRAGGLPLILFSHALTITAGYALVERACLEASRAPGRVQPRARLAAAAAFSAILLGLVNWTVRPQSASFALFGAVVLAVERDRIRPSRWLWALPPLFALWANLHGGFIFGLGLLGIYAACRAGEELARHGALAGARRVLLAAALSAIAATCNPSGPPGTVRYVLGFVQSSATQNLNAEFQPLSARSTDGVIFLGFVALFLVLLYARRARPSPYVLASLLVFGALSLWSRRALPWFGMAAGPAVAWLLASGAAKARPRVAAERAATEGRPYEGTGARGRAAAEGGGAFTPSLLHSSPQAAAHMRRANQALLAALLLGVALTMPWLRAGLPLPAERLGYLRAASTPVGAAADLCALPGRTRTFAEIGFASYLAWACPSASVLTDTRFELYPASLWRDYVEVSAAQFGWEAALDRNGARVLLASKAEQPRLVDAARASREWRIVYEDEDSLLAERQ